MSRAARRRLESQALKGEVIYEILSAFQERGLLFDALEYLRAVAAQVPPEHWRKVACDLGRIADAHALKREKGFDRSLVKEIEGVLKALDGLPTDQKEVIFLGIFQDLSYAEMEAITGTKAVTLRSRMFHGLKRLARAVGASVDEEGGKSS